MIEKNFYTLYKRSKTNKILSYELSVQSNDVSFIIKKTGQIDGKKIVHKEEVSEGKNIGKSNETNHYQQAMSQATSDWNKKMDEGYKSLEDLGILEYLQNGEIVYNDEIDGKKYSLENILDKKLPRFNSNSDGIPLPMLAKKFDEKHVTFPCYINPKLDGVRMIVVASKIGSEVSVKAYSRTGKEYTTVRHILKPIEEYFKTFLTKNYSFILDGELYNHYDLTFQEVVSAVKKESENTKLLKYYVYDVISQDIQRFRVSQLKTILDGINSYNIVAVPYIYCNNMDDIMKSHKKIVSNGYEGSIIRNKEALYEIGQRSSNLLKLKDFDDTEYEFVGFTLGQRGVEDLIANCISDKGIFGAKIAGTRSHKEELYSKEENLKNKVLTVSHFGYTDSGLPRFPIGVSFRDYE